MGKCVIFCAGEFDGLLEDIPESALIIAADGGLRHTLSLGLTPDVILGDFDSLGYVPEGAQVFPVEKDDTDTMLACDMAIQRGARRITILGGTGGRIDHSLSNLFLLEKWKVRGIDLVLCDGDNRVRVLLNETALLRADGFRYFSLIALEPATVSVSGCKYPLHNASLIRTEPYAVSNEITDDAAQITVSGGAVLLIESGREPI